MTTTNHLPYKYEDIGDEKEVEIKARKDETEQWARRINRYGKSKLVGDEMSNIRVSKVGALGLDKRALVEIIRASHCARVEVDDNID